MRDARLAFLALVAYLALATAFSNPAELGGLIACAGLLALAHRRRKKIVPVLAFLLPGFCALPLFVCALSGPRAALETLLRLVALGLGPAVFFLYCDKRGLERLLLNARLPELAVFAFSASLSFIPLVAEEIKATFDAERARGVPLETPWGLFRHLHLLLVPVLLACFRLADELADALIARGLSHRRVPDRRWASLSE
jgi:hypothetical protein